MTTIQLTSVRDYDYINGLYRFWVTLYQYRYINECVWPEFRYEKSYYFTQWIFIFIIICFFVDAFNSIVVINHIQVKILKSEDWNSGNIYIYIYIYMCVCVCVCVCVCACACTHTHTHTHVHARKGVRGEMFIVVGNEHRNWCSNRTLCSLHFTCVCVCACC